MVIPKVKACFFLVVFLIYFFSLSGPQARWATYDDAPAELEFYNSHLLIHQNGKVEETVEKQVKVLNETGRNLFGSERLHYNGNIEKIEILEAKIITQGKEHVIPKKMMEIKPLASDIKGFDQLFQILISYPQVGVGSQLYLKYKHTTFKQPIPRYFATKLFYGEGAYWRQSRVKIKSALPLHMMVNDPQKRLDIQRTQEGQYHQIEMTLTKPACTVLMNESGVNQVADSLKTWVSFSTLNRFEDLSKALAEDYEKVIRQELPPLMRVVKEGAKTKDSPVDQINAVTSLLSEKIRYMGDWRTINGRFSPRSLKTISESGVGDCKDFSVATVAILNALGYHAQVAMVMRDVTYLAPEKELPSLGSFNHAIVKVTAKDGKTFWIDPTNFVSMADGIFADIANRPALVLDMQNPLYEQIPPVDYRYSKMIIDEVVEIKAGDVIRSQGKIHFSGEQAQMLTGAALNQSLQSIEEAIIHQLSGEVSPLQKKITLPDLTSRVVKDVALEYYYEQENKLLLTNVGVGFLLASAWSKAFTDTSDDQEGTTFVGLPSTLVRKIIFSRAQIDQLKALTYDIKTPWVEARRECQIGPEGAEVVEYVTLLKSFMSPQEVKSETFKMFKQSLKKYCSRVAVIISKKGP